MNNQVKYHPETQITILFTRIAKLQDRIKDLEEKMKDIETEREHERLSKLDY